MAPPATENYIDSVASPVSSSSRHSSGPVDATPNIPDLDPEYLKELKRRSLPYKPPRSSSLILPPETLSDDEDRPLTRPIVTTRFHGRASDEAFVAVPARRRSWWEWWRGLCANRRSSLVPISNDMVSTDDENDDMSMNDVDDFVPLDDGMSSNISESLDGATVPAAQIPSPRRYGPLSILWELGQYSTWRPALDLLVFAYRPGVRLVEPMPVQEETILSSDDSQHAWHTENTVPPTNLDNWQGLLGIDRICPTIGNPWFMAEPVGHAPQALRPAHRSLPRPSNAFQSAQRLAETASRSRSRDLTEAALLMRRGVQRMSSGPRIATPTNPVSDHTQNGRNESTTSTTGSTNAPSIVGEGNLTVSEALAGPAPDPQMLKSNGIPTPDA